MKDCSNCRYQLELMKHPMNKDIGHGSIMETMGWVCTCPFEDQSNAGLGIFFDHRDGLCENYQSKIQNPVASFEGFGGTLPKKPEFPKDRITDY